ncbi:MAG: HEPN domain-containing protein [Phycisphaerales bacterium]|nr:MAG: HEPN domain-containing protein [Phycisphaerales bacterium]
MPVRLSKEPIISRDDLREVADVRLMEAEALLKARQYAGAVYLGGYAVECYLKVAVCVTLGWDALLATFKTHDLDGLIRYSGFEGRLREDAGVFESFAKIVDMWTIDTKDNRERKQSVRYRRPSEFDEPTAKRFLQYVGDPATGVVPWLRKVIS